jgi:hypothetical protein
LDWQNEQQQNQNKNDGMFLFFVLFPTGFASMDCLSRIVKKSRNRSVDKQLKLVIPYLSGYLSVSRNDLE